MFKFVHAKSASDIVDPSTTLGIEITVSEVAARASRGNVDGQHGMLATPDAWRGQAAIEIALECDSPPDGTTFVTSRPDLDSVGAMAVLVLRRLGFSGSIDRALVARIAAADSFRPSVSWEPSPLPTLENPWPRIGSVDSTPEIAHLALICSPRRGDFTEALSLAERVAIIACVLAFGEHEIPDGSDMRVLRIYAACGIECGDNGRVRDFTHPSWLCAKAWDAVLRSRQELAVAALAPGALIAHDGLAVVRVAHAGALGLGYCVAPVVVAFDQALPGKVTIAAYGDGYLDARGLTAELNRLELAAAGVVAWTVDVYRPGGHLVQTHAFPTADGEVEARAFVARLDKEEYLDWVVEVSAVDLSGGRLVCPPGRWGGPKNMCSSPQVPGGTRLSETAIVDAVRRFVK